VQIVGPEHDIQIGDLLQEALSLLLGNTTAHGEKQATVAVFQPLELAEATVYLFFRFFPDTAGVQNDEVRTGRVLGGIIADLPEQSDDLLRIADVHLAAEGLDIEQFCVGHITPLTMFKFH
jgi:hypothetical protein